MKRSLVHILFIGFYLQGVYGVLTCPFNENKRDIVCSSLSSITSDQDIHGSKTQGSLPKSAIHLTPATSTFHSGQTIKGEYIYFFLLIFINNKHNTF